MQHLLGLMSPAAFKHMLENKNTLAYAPSWRACLLILQVLEKL